MNLDRRRFQIRLLQSLGILTGFALFFICFAGHWGFGFQVGSVLVAGAVLVAGMYFAYWYVLRFLFLRLPHTVLELFRRKPPPASPKVLEEMSKRLENSDS